VATRPELDAIHRRREQAAAARRRRRLVALAALIAAAGVTIAVIVLATGGGGGSATSTTSSGGQSVSSGGGGSAAKFPPSWRPYRGPVPILEYHAIQPPVASSAYPQLFVTQADFQRQMQWLSEQGFEAVTLDQVEDAWYKDGELPGRPVVVSFDDGYLSQYVAGFLVLQNYHWPGVLNLLAQGSDLPDGDVTKMLDAGWELASHTITHVDLTTVDATQLEREVAGSRQILRQRFDVPVDNFCYPAGRYDDTVISAVAKAGYRGAQTEIPGVASADHPYILDRIEIELDDGLQGFIEKLRSAGAV
jgi:peptidoglycan/xylan/chitin deacetylase (PgdA/CDA1 family)